MKPDEIATVLQLNAESVSALHPLDRRELEEMASYAYEIAVTPHGDAMMIVFDETARTTGPNFTWFKARYPRFLYVDRIAIAEHARGKGLGRRLYAELFERAAHDGYPLVAAEVHCDPPNDESLAFHAAMGFTPVGEQYLSDRAKTVRYFVREIASASA